MISSGIVGSWTELTYCDGLIASTHKSAPMLIGCVRYPTKLINSINGPSKSMRYRYVMCIQEQAPWQTQQ